MLLRDRFCRWRGCDQVSVIADHIVPTKQGGSHFALENGQGLCRAHHNVKTARDGSRGYHLKEDE